MVLTTKTSPTHHTHTHTHAHIKLATCTHFSINVTRVDLSVPLWGHTVAACASWACMQFTWHNFRRTKVAAHLFVCLLIAAVEKLLCVAVLRV